ncbi:MAG: protein-disulfide reductase DsbD N-terminal domain-containing protein [Gemmataceae bacterium]|nr:protein-disulfide reductase DsbD N-terminal domain-containing protein [Gemmataceae bacterium]
MGSHSKQPAAGRGGRGAASLSLAVLVLSTALLSAAGIPRLSAPSPSSFSAMTAQKWFEKAVSRLEASFTPAQARRGQTVTFTLTLQLQEGYYTYPTRQSDPQAAALVNDLRFPDPQEVIFVGTVEDPKNVRVKAEPQAGIQSLRYCTGTVTYTRAAVVHPQARPGPVTVRLPRVRLNICDASTCFPAKEVAVEAALTILDGPPLPVEERYAEEVRRVLEKSPARK